MIATTDMEVPVQYGYRVSDGEIQLEWCVIFNVQIPLRELTSLALDQLQEEAEEDYRAILRSREETQWDGERAAL